ncbi:MAG: hypothetical protein IJK84_10970 [Bacteroidales bacterium]|nr:hypothetical protein [Bacteroidales bacterium]MBQ7512625.1 hypothetical protein [Prevotella sp.]
MFYNATFRYKKSAQPARDANGFLTDSPASEYVDGALCQAERVVPARHLIGTDGQEFAYSYEVFMPRNYSSVLEIGDTLELTFDTGHTATAPIVGIDITNKKTLVVWL